MKEKQNVQFGFVIEEGMGANTSISVLLDRAIETFVDVAGPNNVSLRETSDYLRLSIPDVAQVFFLRITIY